MPIVSFGISLIVTSGIEFEQTGAVFGAIGVVVSTFLLYNIPTAVLLAIYAGFRGKRNRQRALEKMNVQDLD